MKILLCCPMLDGESGHYIHNSLIQLNNKVAFFDWRAIAEKKGVEFMNNQLIDITSRLTPDLILIVKGLGITPETIKQIKKNIETKVVGWIFDVTLGGTMVKDAPPYVSFIKELDKFYTIDDDAVDELKDLGVNADWLPEGCFEEAHEEQIINSIQARQFGSDVVFLGSVGSIHPNREKILKRIYDEGFKLKIYGEVYYKEGTEPGWVKECHTGYSASNEKHSIACQSSKIVLGIDGWPERKKSWSARIYRTLCCGAFYLTTETRGIAESDLCKGIGTYENVEDLIEKLSYWLTEDDKREEVAKKGQKLVLEKYQFKHALKRLIDESGASSMEEYLV